MINCFKNIIYICRSFSILYKNRVFHRLANLTIPITISILGAGLPDQYRLFPKASGILGVIIVLLFISALLNAVDEIYRRHEISKTRPIRSLLQVIKIALYIIAVIVVVAILVGESPIVLLGGIGAMTAIISLIFKDAILGFVAGVQLTGNDMIRIGDWIEAPGHSADGIVIDLSMTPYIVRSKIS